jgi:hypothetical protein
MLLPGSYWLKVRAVGYLSQVALVPVTSGPASRADFVLDQDLGRLTSLVGTVRDAATGVPIADTTVTMIAPLSEQFVTDSTGAYWFSEVPEGAALVEVVAGRQSLQTGFQLSYPETSVDLLLDGLPRRPGGRER